MPIDPVCSREVDLRTAHSMKIVDGRGIYFCCDDCARTFTAQPRKYDHLNAHRRLTIGVMGSAADDEPTKARNTAFDLGAAIASKGFVLITGACPGLPNEAARGAKHLGGHSVGISPALSLHEHLYRYHSPADAFDVLVYTGSGLMGREVTNIHSSDMVIILGGRSGTLGEFAIAYDEGKLIGVLQGTGGISDEIERIIDTFNKDTGAKLIYSRDPAELVTDLAGEYENRHFRRPSCFCDAGAMPPG
ncbi:MAG: protein containing YHS domain protein [Gammaproteobacteria bacterium]|nr:protein containing YHS domain protein [Gammaproteobacteria bacterium]NIM74999.1 protein containing YHS domain protein [Gammaproteobacteria bacterium]NIN38470.1 protein containing YHS domain protein [Gammaproteobacteria bacterium]NIO23850.1 protein containing YHS domain protein [Gammaproteobacteria bacterium]NIO64492.1 protein containing YHS domain protein [Gammaproteobacteria bacterium]